MEENKTQPSETSPVNPDANLLETIKDLKANTVSRAEYDRVLHDRDEFAKAIANGYMTEEPKQEVVKSEEEIAEIRNQLLNCDDFTNLDFVTKMLEVRNHELKMGREDPFLPKSVERRADAYNVEIANDVANALQHCVDYASGDKELFTQELYRLMR